MERDAKLMADILSAGAPDEPSANELVAYARDPSSLGEAQRARVERSLAASPAQRDRFRALAPPDWTLIGSCLCGEVRYAVRGPLQGIGHCHCRRCRKAHAAAFGSFALVPVREFSWQQGPEHLRRFGGSDDSSQTFCGQCGTTLTGTAPPGQVAIAVATLDVDPVVRPVLHASVADRAPWYEITDDVAQRPGPFHTSAPADTGEEELR